MNVGFSGGNNITEIYRRRKIETNIAFNLNLVMDNTLPANVDSKENNRGRLKIKHILFLMAGVGISFAIAKAQVPSVSSGEFALAQLTFVWSGAVQMSLPCSVVLFFLFSRTLPKQPGEWYLFITGISKAIIMILSPLLLMQGVEFYLAASSLTKLAIWGTAVYANRKHGWWCGWFAMNAITYLIPFWIIGPTLRHEGLYGVLAGLPYVACLLAIFVDMARRHSRGRLHFAGISWYLILEPILYWLLVIVIRIW